MKSHKSVFGRMPLTRKITWFYGIMFAVAILVVCGFVALNAAVIFEDQVKMQLKNTVENIKIAARNTDVPELFFDDYLGDKYVELIIKNVDSGAVYSNEVGETPDFIKNISVLKDIDIDTAEESFEKFEAMTSIINLESDLSGRVMVAMDKCETKNGRYLIVAYKFFKDNFAYVKDFAVKMLVFGGICIYLVYLVGRHIGKKVLDPITELTETASRMSVENLSQRIDVPETNDEVRELCITFNSMMDRLEDSFKKQERFVSDASHELRTPISVIQGYANLLNRWGKNDSVVLQESIDSIIAETQHMSKMVRKMLFLAKSDRNKIEIEKGVISLNEIAESVVKDMNMLDEGRDVKFLSENDAFIFADGNLIKQLINIYIENSFKHTDEGGEIDVKVWHDGEYAYLSVKDNGTGIEDSKIPYIFDRFFKADESRSGKVPGTGIGLSIAKQIIDIHGGQVEVKSRVGEGTEIINKFVLFDK